MKHAAGILLRVAIAVCIATSISLCQYSVWWHLSGRGVQQGPCINETAIIKGFAFSGFQRHQSPFKGSYPTREQLAADLDIVSRISRGLRVYGTTEMPTILGLSGDRDMVVTAGAWLDQNHEKNEREVAALITAARKMQHVERVIVGNEAILRDDLTPAELIEYMERVRNATRKPVSTAEPWGMWLKHPELAEHVDFITVHLLPYHEGVPIEIAVDHAYRRYDELAKAFPNKIIVVGEIGWPSKGTTIGAAIPSPANQAHFIRALLAHPRTVDIDYYLMEAIDQPWKTEAEGWAGPYWGMFDAYRRPKFALQGIIERDPLWFNKACSASISAFLPMLLVAFYLSEWTVVGRVFLAALVQACFATLSVGLNMPAEYYLTQRDLAGLRLLFVAGTLTVSVLLCYGFEFGETMFRKEWRRRFVPLPFRSDDDDDDDNNADDSRPFVSVHLACYNEPPEMVIAAIDSLAKMNYRNLEVLVLDNNTPDEALWRPLQKRCAELSPRFRFFHLVQWPGYKAGALNYGLMIADARTEVVGVVDADYVVDEDWLASLMPHFDKPEVAVVQAPQAHRDWNDQPFKRMCNWELDAFFRIGMHHRNERNALIQHGTMTLVRRAAMEDVGGWSEWCICEDTELGLRLIEQGYKTRYVDHVLGRGLTPSDFAAIKTQRFRWAFGAMQILKAHLPQMVGRSELDLAQRYHFLTGWSSWIGDAMQLVFACSSLAWTLAIVLFPKTTGPPIIAMAMTVVGLWLFKAALGAILYRYTMDCPWADIAGAMVLSVGLAHAIARGVFAGLVKKNGVFFVTPKGWRGGGALAFFNPIREEMAMLVALISAASLLVIRRGATDAEMQVWVGVIIMQCIPYIAAILCQVAAYMPSNGRAAAVVLARCAGGAKTKMV